MAVITGAIARDAIRQTIIAGGAAGAHTVTGIKATDTLVSVLNTTDGVDLTSEFSISAADEIDNTSGTSTAADDLVVTYLSVAS